MTDIDRRITPVRDDLAAEALKGTIAAPRYAAGKPHTIVRGRMALRAKPTANSIQETELLYGETFTIYESANGWAWGQATLDRYVGYVHTIACQDVAFQADGRVTALATPLLPAPDIKRPALDMLPMNAKVQVLSREKGFARIAPAGFVREVHIAPLTAHAADWVAVAERFLGTPYVWGGKTHAGLDCSGLLQTALEAGGIVCPRDTDMQESALGSKIELADARRGDLVFWEGHVGVMLDAQRIRSRQRIHHGCRHRDAARGDPAHPDSARPRDVGEKTLGRLPSGSDFVAVPIVSAKLCDRRQIFSRHLPSTVITRTRYRAPGDDGGRRAIQHAGSRRALRANQILGTNAPVDEK